MIEVAYLREQEKVKSLPEEVQGTIKGILQRLDTEYGADRSKYEDDGGYVVVLEEKEDIEELSDFICDDLETEAIPEFVELIKCKNGQVYTNSLILSNNEFGVSVFMPLEITPENLKGYITE